MRKLAREPKAPKKKDTLQKLFLYQVGTTLVFEENWDTLFEDHTVSFHFRVCYVRQLVGDYLYFIMGKIVIICCAEIKC